jgi:hypothetical protein
MILLGTVSNQLWTLAERPVFLVPIARLAEVKPLIRSALATDETSYGPVSRRLYRTVITGLDRACFPDRCSP